MNRREASRKGGLNDRGIPWPQHEHQMVRFTALVSYWYYQGIHYPEARGPWTSPASFACASASRRLGTDFGALTLKDAALCANIATDMDPVWCLDIILKPNTPR